MSNQIIIVCDDQGNPTGEYIPKEVGHTGEGKKHFGVTVLLYNNKEEVLLQRRKHQVFDNIWCFTGDTHRLHTESGDESLEEAVGRCLEVEYNITDPVPLKNLGFFHYFEKIDGLCENEYCAMMIGKYNGHFELNSDVGYEYLWMKKEDFLHDFEQNPKKYAPWIPGGMEILQEKGFFN